MCQCGIYKNFMGRLFHNHRVSNVILHIIVKQYNNNTKLPNLNYIARYLINQLKSNSFDSLYMFEGKIQYMYT